MELSVISFDSEFALILDTFSFLFFFCLIVNFYLISSHYWCTGISVPMAQRHCTPTDIIKVTVGSPLYLECDSHCPAPAPQGDNAVETSTESSFSWRKLLDINDGGRGRGRGSSGSVVKLPDTVDPALSIESVTHEDGGHYVCKCLPNGPECMYNVSGKSYFIPRLESCLHENLD